MSAITDLLTEPDKERVEAAIGEAELHTIGEIRIHLENWCWSDPYKHAVDIFRRMEMDRTAERSGVLIYIAVKSHKLAIVGDEGINRVVPEHFWASVVHELQVHFGKQQYADGLIAAVAACGQILAQHFPKTPDNPNELSNEISFG